ncbi:MAG: hypothetical protein H0X35_04340 [Pseudonocardiales bacterium]|nr:hypothetical protein [Pseudonocardiales bacterium]
MQQQLGRDDRDQQRWGQERVLPAEYVQTSVELAYASTVHAALGRTVDTSHALVDAAMDRVAFYVALTPGMLDNVAYVILGGPEEHRLSRLAALLERGPAALSATEVQAQEFDAVRHLARLGPEWSQRVTEQATEEYRAVLAELLSPAQMKQVDADEANGTLYRRLRTAELDGVDAAQILAAAVHSRELETAESIADVLYWRVERRLAEAEAARDVPDPEAAEQSELEFVARSFAERTPEGRDEAGVYLRNLAELMDERAAWLAEQAAASPPTWAERLGPVPEDDPLARMEWTERAAAVAAYREQFGHSSETDPIGRRPKAGEPERREAWEQAAAALGIVAQERELAGNTDAELANMVEVYQREEAWMPPNVDPELRAASLDARTATGRVTRLHAELEALGRDDDGRAAASERIDHADALAERMARRSGGDRAGPGRRRGAGRGHAHTGAGRRRGAGPARCRSRDADSSEPSGA